MARLFEQCTSDKSCFVKNISHFQTDLGYKWCQTVYIFFKSLASVGFPQRFAGRIIWPWFCPEFFFFLFVSLRGSIPTVWYFNLGWKSSFDRSRIRLARVNTYYSSLEGNQAFRMMSSSNLYRRLSQQKQRLNEPFVLFSPFQWMTWSNFYFFDNRMIQLFTFSVPFIYWLSVDIIERLSTVIARSNERMKFLEQLGVRKLETNSVEWDIENFQVLRRLSMNLPAIAVAVAVADCLNEWD